MAQILREITVDVAQLNRFQAIVAKQYDRSSRFLKVRLTNLDEPIDVHAGSVVVINARRADGQYDSFAGTVNADGTVTVPLTYWMLELDDVVKCDIAIIDGEETVLKTTLFELYVEEAAAETIDIDDDPNYDVLVSLIATVSQYDTAIQTAQATADSATEAAENAVSYAEAQTLTEAEMEQARENLGVATAFEFPNLFDASNVVAGTNTFKMYINASGTHALTTTTDYRLIAVPVEEGHTYIVSCGGTSTKRLGYITEAPAAGVAVSGYYTITGTLENYSITIGEGGTYLCLQLFISSDTDLTPANYYDSIVIRDAAADAIAIDTPTRGRVTALESDMSAVKPRAMLTVEYAANPISGYVNANTGKITSGASYERTDYVAVSTTMQYRYSGRTYKTAGLVAYDQNKKYIASLLPVGTGSDDYTDELLTLPAGTAYIIASNYTSYPGTFSLKSTGDPGVEVAKLIAASAAQNELEPQDMTCASMFERIGICGDSYASGNVYDIAPFSGRHENISWGKIFGRRNGIDVELYSKAGANTTSWQTDTSCLPLLLSDDPCQLYVLILGINTEGQDGVADIGSIEDVNDEDPTQNADTMYGRYAKIYHAIHNYSPDSKIVFATPAYKPASIGAVWTAKLGCINELAAHYEVPVIDMMSDAMINTSFYSANLRTGHPIAPVYAGIAVAFEKRLAKCIVDNVEYFTNYVGATGSTT